MESLAIKDDDSYEKEGVVPVKGTILQTLQTYFFQE